MCFNSYKTTWRADIKFGTIDDHPEVNAYKVCDVVMTS